MLRNLKVKICRKCKEEKKLFQSGFCKECYLEIDRVRQEKRKDSRLQGKDGYVRVYNDDGKLVLEHRHLMEKALGRKLEKEEAVIHLDNDKGNNDLSNLAVTLKNGTPITRLKCNQCGSVGNFSILPPSAES